MVRVHWAAVVFLLALLSPVQAADWPVARGPSREPAPYRYDPAQWKQVPKEYLDDASACVVYAGTNYLVEADGTIETVTHEVTRLNSRKSLQDLGEYRSIYYDPTHEKLTLNEARVFKPDGTTVAVGPRHVQLRDAATDYQVYDHSKQLIVSYPSLEVGDVVEIKWTTRGKNPEHHGQFFTRYTLGADTYPIVHDEIRIRLPKDRVLKHAVTGGKLAPKITEQGGERTFHWEVRNRPQLPQDEHLPSKELLRLQVSASTFGSWDDVWKWKQTLRKDCWTCTAEIRRIVQETTKDVAEPLDKARALTYWVRRNIRYVSVGEKHDYTPHAPAAVLANRFGDCKDTSQLLAVMLKEAGVPVALATLGVRDDGQVLEEVPSPWGTHAILLVSIAGIDHWIDTTSSLAGWDTLPRDDRDRLCYVTDDKGIQLVRTPALKPEDNRIVQATTMTVGADGSARCERIASYYGLAALKRRQDWVDVPNGERRRDLTGELQDANSKTRLVRFQLDEKELANYDHPVHASMAFDVLNQFGDENASEREGSLTDSPVWNHLLFHTLSYDRAVPLELDRPFESMHRYTLQLPPYFALGSTPSERSVRSRWGFFTLTVQRVEGSAAVELNFHTRIHKTHVATEEFDEFRRFAEDVARSYRVWLTLRPVRTLPETPLIEALVHLTPGDGAAAVLLAELYLHNDKAAEARRVLNRARRYHPDHARLGELAVKAAANVVEETVVYRDLAKHFPTDSGYQVALARVLIDQGKHAEARTLCKSVLERGSAGLKAQANFQLARSSFAENKAAEALKHFEAAVQADWETVNNVSALRFKANVLEKLKKPKEAAEAYREALDVDADAAEPLESLVKLEIAAGNPAKALDYLRRFGAVMARDGNGLARAADQHLRLERYEDALDLALRARDLADGNPLVQRTLGLVYLKRDDYTKAAFHLERADADADVLHALIRCRLALGQLHLAIQDAGHADKVSKADAALVAGLAKQRQALLTRAKTPPTEAFTDAIDRYVCADLAFRAGKPPALVEGLIQGACKADLGPALALRGLLALEKGRLTTALADAERAVTLDPKHPTGYLVRGRVRLERGHADALADLEKAAELSERQDAVVLHWLAAALHGAGKQADALKTQQLAVKLRPGDRELMEQLQMLEKAKQQ